MILPRTAVRAAVERALEMSESRIATGMEDVRDRACAAGHRTPWPAVTNLPGHPNTDPQTIRRAA